MRERPDYEKEARLFDATVIVTSALVLASVLVWIAIAGRLWWALALLAVPLDMVFTWYRARRD